MRPSLYALMILLAIGSACLPVRAADPLDAGEVARRAHQAAYYAGNDFVARVDMRLVDAGGQERLRQMSMLRKDMKSGGEQRYFIYFAGPADIRDTTFLVYKYPQRDDSRWLFIPAIQMVRRIAANDRHSSFVGSDFTYEDVSGRDVAADAHRVLRDENLRGRACVVLESTPREEADYARKVSWIDRATWLPLQEEYFDARGELIRVFTADEVQTVQGVPTAVRRTMRNAATGHRTLVTLSNVRYDVGLADAVFTERSLRRPPRQWLR